MRFIAAIILVLALAGLPSCKFLKNNVFGKKARLAAEMQAIKDSIRVADSIKAANEKLLAFESARQDSLRRAEEERLAAETRYNIIVGSFITPEYAKSMAAEYTSMGYSTRLIKPANSKFELVAAEGHKSLRKAITRLEQFRDTVQLESWIYVNQ
ncbi:MAG TPA: hypothetical protein VK155_15270 [Bacteroidales bacterium]|jgi:hypothetical protein|nr:hypothetical protein [Bacteroidales bacterium]